MGTEACAVGMQNTQSDLPPAEADDDPVLQGDSVLVGALATIAQPLVSGGFAACACGFPAIRLGVVKFVNIKFGKYQISHCFPFLGVLC